MQNHCISKPMSIQCTIRRALPQDELETKDIVEACLKEANTVLSAFQIEERRRVSEEERTTITWVVWYIIDN